MQRGFYENSYYNNYNIMVHFSNSTNNKFAYGGKKMVFGRKKKEEVKETVEQHTEVVNVGTENEELKTESEELTTEQVKVKEMIDWYNEEYNGIFNPQDFVAIPANVHFCNLLHGILQEQKKTNEYFKEMLEK